MMQEPPGRRPAFAEKSAVQLSNSTLAPSTVLIRGRKAERGNGFRDQIVTVFRRLLDGTARVDRLALVRGNGSTGD